MTRCTPWKFRGSKPFRRMMSFAMSCGSATSGEKGLTPPTIGSIGTVVSMTPGTTNASPKTLDRKLQWSTSLYVARSAQNGMRASSRSWKKPGAPSVRSNAFSRSRNTMSSDSPHEIDCRPTRSTSGPFL